MTGYAWVGGNLYRRGFLWVDGLMSDLGTLGGQDSTAASINDLDQVAGSAQTATGDTIAVLWDEGTVTPLGTLGGNYSNARGINNHGQIVGRSLIDDEISHAYIWEDGVMRDLNDLIPVDSELDYLVSPASINDLGQIVVSGYVDGIVHGFLLTPILAVPLDISPKACPNYLEVGRGGYLRVALPGDVGFDPMEVDVDSLTLAGVSAVRSAFVDVASPFVPYLGKEFPDDCTDARRDGYVDLLLKIGREAVVSALEAELGRPLQDGEVLVLTLTGNLIDGIPIQGEDVVVVSSGQ